MKGIQSVCGLHGSSWAWRAVSKGKNVVHADLSWSVGDGKQVNVTPTEWSSDLPICRWPTSVDMSYFTAAQGMG